MLGAMTTNNSVGGQHLRFYSTKPQLTHINEKGEARMVDISSKEITKRRASAEGFIRFSTTLAISQITENTNKKGDVLSIARISGISAIKKTPDLIILCHPLPLTKAEISVEILSDTEMRVLSTAHCQGKTGVEMEALVGCTTALLNIYDMCKAVDKHMVIHGVRVLSKAGGKSDFDVAQDS